MNNSGERGEHANNIDHGVAAKLLTVLSDGSPVVRKVSLAPLTCITCTLVVLHCCYTNLIFSVSDLTDRNLSLSLLIDS